MGRDQHGLRPASSAISHTKYRTDFDFGYDLRAQQAPVSTCSANPGSAQGDDSRKSEAERVSFKGTGADAGRFSTATCRSQEKSDGDTPF